MKKDRERWLFYPLLLSVALIIIPSIISLIFLMKFSLSHSISTAEQSNERMLLQIRDQIESVYGELEMISASLAMNPSINSLYRDLARNDNPDFFKIYETQKKLPRYELSNKYVQGVDILFKNGNVVLSPSGSTVDFYGSLKNKLTSSPNGPDTDEILWGENYHSRIIKTKDGLWFLSSFPFGAGTPKALIVIKIDKSEFYRLLSFFDVGEEGQIEVIEGNGGTSITYPEETRNFETSKILTNRATAHKGTWEVVSRVPYSYVLKSVRSTRITLLAVTIASISLTMFLGFLLLKWNSLPIIRLIAKLDPVTNKEALRTGRGNGYELINSRVDSMLAERQSIKKQLAMQKSFLQRSYLLNLIRGDYGDRRESQELAEIAGLSSDFFPVALIIIQSAERKRKSVNSYSQRDKMGDITSRFLTEDLKTPVIFYPLEEGGLLFLISVSHLKDPRESLKKELLFQLEKEGLAPLSIFYGGIGEDAEEIHNAYSRAEQLAQTTETTTSGFYSVEDTRVNVKAFTYPVEWEVKLLTYVNAGNRVKADELLEKIGRANFREKDNCLLAQRHFISLLYGTLTRCTLTIKELPAEIQDPYESFSIIRARLLEVAESHARKKREEDDELRDTIQSYIRANYSDPAFTLYHLASYTGFSESLLYNTFKSLFGQTFASYLEALRISKSTELLEKGEKIVDTAALTGFNNSQTFRRVFKRKTGITPSNFVNSLF